MLRQNKLIFKHFRNSLPLVVLIAIAQTSYGSFWEKRFDSEQKKERSIVPISNISYWERLFNTEHNQGRLNDCGVNIDASDESCQAVHLRNGDTLNKVELTGAYHDIEMSSNTTEFSINTIRFNDDSYALYADIYLTCSNEIPIYSSSYIPHNILVLSGYSPHFMYNVLNRAQAG